MIGDNGAMSTPGRLGIGIIGMGHVGPVIGSALRAVGHQIVAVSASSEASRERADAMLPPRWSSWPFLTTRLAPS